MKHAQKAVALVGMLVVTMSFGYYGCSPSKSSAESPAAGKSEAPASNWSYSEKKDEMSNMVTYFAECTSTNELNFKFPYDGGSKGKITLRKSGSINEVLLSISKGQFLPSFMGDKFVRVKFDSAVASSYTYRMPSSGESTVIFLDKEDAFLKNLKKASKVKIEVEFYNEGSNILEFDVAGFKWDH